MRVYLDWRGMVKDIRFIPKIRLKPLAFSLLVLLSGVVVRVEAGRPYPDTLPRITEIHLEGGNYTALDVSKCDTLLSVTCSNNKLETLSVAGCNTLTILECPANKLKNIDLSENIHLQRLNCTDNALTELNVSNALDLVNLRCSGNRIKDLDVSNLSELDHVGAEMSSLRTFKAVNCTKLGSILIGDSVKEMDLTRCASLKCAPLYRLMEEVRLDSCLSLRTLERIADNRRLNLVHLTAKQTDLDVLDVSNSKLKNITLVDNNTLTKLNCSRSLLTDLDVSACKNLKSVSVDSARLEVISISGLSRLETLRCNYNTGLTKLNIAGCDALKELHAGACRLQSIRGNSNYLQAVNVADNALPLSQIYPLLQSRKQGDIFQLLLQNDTTTLETGKVFDASRDISIGGQPSTWKLTIAKDDAEFAKSGYEESGGLFRFLKSGEYRLRLTNASVQDYGNGTDATPVEFVWYIKVTGKDIQTANEEGLNNRQFVYARNKTIHLSEPMGKVQVFNVSGQMIYSGTDTEIPVKTSGLYMVRSCSNVFKISVK